MSGKPPDDRSRNPPDAPAAAGAETAAQPHDAFFRAMFSDPAHAAAVLKSILPPQVARHVDWDSLQAVHASMVSNELAQQHGDLLFQGRQIDGRDVFVWLMFEHQSKVEPLMSWRMTGMVFHFLGHWLEQHPEARRLPPVLPVVLYQGTRRWRAPTSLLELTDVSDEARRDLAPLLLSLGFVLEDLGAVDDEELDARALSVVPRLTLGVMKHYRSRDVIAFMHQHREDLRTLDATEPGRVWLFRLLSYIRFVNPDIDRDTLASLLSSVLGREIEPTMLSFDEMIVQRFGQEVLDQAYDRGVEKGVEEGVERGQREILLRQLARRFGALPDAIAERVARAGTEEIERWSDRILDAASLDEVFAAS